MSGNGRAEIPRSAGFFISMAGLGEIVFAGVVALLLDDYLPDVPSIVGGVTVGQAVAVIMALAGVLVFFYGRHLGWQARLATRSIGSSGKNSNNNPVRRM